MRLIMFGFLGIAAIGVFLLFLRKEPVRPWLQQASVIMGIHMIFGGLCAAGAIYAWWEARQELLSDLLAIATIVTGVSLGVCETILAKTTRDKPKTDRS